MPTIDIVVRVAIVASLLYCLIVMVPAILSNPTKFVEDEEWYEGMVNPAPSVHLTRPVIEVSATAGSVVDTKPAVWYQQAS